VLAGSEYEFSSCGCHRTFPTAVPTLRNNIFSPSSWYKSHHISLPFNSKVEDKTFFFKTLIPVSQITRLHIPKCLNLSIFRIVSFKPLLRNIS
jgi:hypothetical protein